MFVLELKGVKKGHEEKKQEVDNLLAVLDNGVKSFVTDPEKFKAMLEMQALFRNYSFRNVVLIQEQMPNESEYKIVNVFSLKLTRQFSLRWNYGSLC
jgi:hypothetical protein